DGALLVDPRDEAQIRAAVERLLGSTALAHQLSERGRRNATRFDAMGIADQYAGIYARACRGGDLRDPRGGSQAGLQAGRAIDRCSVLAVHAVLVTETDALLTFSKLNPETGADLQIYYSALQKVYE
ncbi:MAG: hypothetical protein ABSB59_21510, partial [Streptosporangiaceae bacterium]